MYVLAYSSSPSWIVCGVRWLSIVLEAVKTFNSVGKKAPFGQQYGNSDDLEFGCWGGAPLLLYIIPRLRDGSWGEFYLHTFFNDYLLIEFSS